MSSALGREHEPDRAEPRESCSLAVSPSGGAALTVTTLSIPAGMRRAAILLPPAAHTVLIHRVVQEPMRATSPAVHVPAPPDTSPEAVSIFKDERQSIGDAALDSLDPRQRDAF